MSRGPERVKRPTRGVVPAKTLMVRAPSPLDDYRKGITINDENWKEVLDKTRSFKKEEVDWIGTLIALFGKENPPELLYVRKLDTALDMAIAYSLNQPQEKIAEVSARVKRLRNLRYDDDSPVFPSPFSKEAIAGTESAQAELTARLGELSSGRFDSFAFGEATAAAENLRPLKREELVWLNSQTIEDEETMERTKFLQLGRAEGEISGPLCPKCESRNTVIMTLQLRSNDEAASSQFYCKNCEYTTTQWFSFP